MPTAAKPQLLVAPGETESTSTEKREPKPTKVLPTNRVAIAKQFEIIRAFGACAGSERKAVSNIEVSRIVALHNATVGLLTPFLVDIGLISRVGNGLMPCEEVVDCAGAHEWNAESAFHRVAPILRRTWFFAKLEPKLRFRPLTKNEAIQELSIASSAGPSYRNHLETLLDYLEKAGLVSQEGDQVRLMRVNDAVSESERYMPKDDPTPDSAFRGTVSTSFASQPAGVVAFNISVKVDMAEMSTWEPTRITAFFAGIAQVLAAKGTVEEKSTRT